SGKMGRVGARYDTREVFTFQIAPESDELKAAASYARFHLAFMERLRALPGVKSVGIVDHVPLNEDLDEDTFTPAERAGDSRGGVLLGFTSVAGDYCQTMGIRLLAGRALTEQDQLTDLGHVVINRSAANLLWPGQDPIATRSTSDAVQ